ncbi:Ulp1 protease family, C-terminal catalytic domain [Musa troglodytarum]|uniref:Ulp1 protease family, C-terminal catalytic domain n=1 Tax=Musa troglodytarum TaxID=320322 RepID=A0A9E7H2L7_9LILI|nr:Ulp1 protease family, C-terminal catalytic domain [Musa troglodytarum]
MDVDACSQDTSGWTLKGDITSGLRIDMHKRDNDRDSYAVDVPEQGLALNYEKAELDEIMASSTSYDEHGQMHPDEFEDGMVVDVTSDDEESLFLISGSESSAASDSGEDEGCLECSDSETCYAATGDVFSNQMGIKIFPDYVIHGSTSYGESQVVFSADCIKIKCSDAIGSDEKFSSEWAVADIVHIVCRWSGSVTTASVKLCLRENDVTKNEKHHNDSGFLEVRFSVNDMCWMDKEQRIRNLAARYEHIWNASFGDMLWKNYLMDPNALRDFFAIIAESLEDVIYPKGDPNAVSISKRDIEFLQPETFINDTIIDFYIKYLENKIQPNQKHKFHFFNSFFYRKLVGKDQGGVSEGREAFLRVRRWTQKSALEFACYLSSWRNNEIESDKVPCILHMDSIKGCHSGLQKIIQSYIWEEWKERHPETTEDDSWKFLKLRFVSPELPQQENSFDCGLFLLHYVELFLKEVPVNFDLFKITRFSSFLSAKWFPPVEASLKRSVIRKLIYELLNDRSEKIDRSTCSTGCPSTSGHPEDNTERELLAAHCSPAMGVMGDAICQDTEDGEKLVAVEDSQEADKTKAVCRVCEGCQKICASEADCQIVDGREITTNANEVDVTDCQVPSAIGAVDREDGGCELDTNEAEGEDGKDCGETTSNAVRQDDKSSVIHITEVESGDGSCQENRPSFEGVIITVDETSSDDNDDVRVTHKKPVQKLRKRGKVMIPEGRRVRTRSVTKAQHNDT